ncbi:MAG TPA: hypothetical protein VGN57_19000 [Pirellulaceae bacterium]|jgi:hypothetical protein|nr:hypothetical protein [Pirellulaceae bacterium]
MYAVSVDMFPKLFGTLKAHPTFASFNDSKGRFKVFDGDESPTAQTPFITVDFLPVNVHRLTEWSEPEAMFHVTGEGTDASELWRLAREVRDIFCDSNIFSDGTHYEVLGPALFSQSRNPITEHKVVTVSLHFGVLS